MTGDRARHRALVEVEGVGERDGEQRHVLGAKVDDEIDVRSGTRATACGAGGRSDHDVVDPEALERVRDQEQDLERREHGQPSSVSGSQP